MGHLRTELLTIPHTPNMNTFLYILIAWIVLDIVVYVHMFFDIKSTQINFKERLAKLYEAFTEEE